VGGGKEKEGLGGKERLKKEGEKGFCVFDFLIQILATPFSTPHSAGAARLVS